MPVRASLLPSSTACVLGPPRPGSPAGTGPKGSGGTVSGPRVYGALSPTRVGPAGGQPLQPNFFNQVDLGSGRDTR